MEENNEDMDAFLVPPDGGERIENRSAARSSSRFAARKRARL
jgi:hypothetical protein